MEAVSAADSPAGVAAAAEAAAGDAPSMTATALPESIEHDADERGDDQHVDHAGPVVEEHEAHLDLVGVLQHENDEEREQYEARAHACDFAVAAARGTLISHGRLQP